MADDEETYHPKDAIDPTLKTGAILGFAGLFVSSVQATLTRSNIGALGTFTRYGSNIALFAATGATFEFVQIAAANLRQRDDTINKAIGGFFGGAVLGLQFRRLAPVFYTGAGLSIIMATFDYQGGRLEGYAREAQEDEYARKEALRANKRRPIQETIQELGEGRGIYAPGYRERRAERIKQTYGIDVPSQ